MRESDLVATMTVHYASDGEGAVAAGANTVAAAQDRVSASAQAMATSTEAAARRQVSAAAAYDALSRRLDPASRAFLELQRNTADYNRILAQNSEALDRAGQPLSVYRDRLNAAAVAAENLRRQQLNASVNQGAGFNPSAANTSTYAAQFAGMADAADAKARQIGQQFGVSLDESLIAGVAKSARDSSSIFAAEMDRLDTISQQKAMQVGKNFQEGLDASLIAGVSKSARDSATVFTAELDRLDTIAQQKATQIGKNFQDDLNKSFNIGGSSKSASQSADVFKETIIAQEDAVTRLRTAINPLQVEQGKLGVEMANYKTLLQQGKITTTEYAQAQEMAGKRLFDFNQNLHQVGAGGRVAANEMTNLSFQINDVISGLVMGQSPFRIIAQQGGQFFQIFQQSKSSIADFARSSIDWLGSLFTVGRVAFGGIATAIGGVIYANASYISSQREVNQSLIGIGARTQTTAAQINDFAKQNASATGLSVDQARTVAVEFTKTGNIAVAGLTGVGNAIHGFSVLTGQSVDEASKTFAKAFSGDVATGAEELNKTYGFLNASTRDYIRTLELQGDRSKAIQVVLDAIAKDNKRAEDSVSLLTKAYDLLANAASKAKNAIGAGTAPQSNEDQLAALEKQKAALEQPSQQRFTDPSRLITGLFSGSVVSPSLDSINKALDVLKEKIAGIKADNIAKQFQAWSLAADDVTKATIPQIKQLEDLQKAEMALVLGRNLNDPRADAALTSNRNQQASTKEAEGDAARYGQRVKEISQSWAGVGQSTALALQASSNNLPVIQAVGGAARMAAQYAADYWNALDKGKAPADALSLAIDNLANSQAAANSSVQAQTWSLQNNLGVSQAWTAATQMKAQAEATYNQLLHDGVSAEVAGAAAAAQYADSKAKAVASAEKLVQSSQDSVDKALVQGTAMESVVNASIAYRDAMQAGATATQAAAISANTLEASLISAAQAAQKVDAAAANAATAAYIAGGGGTFKPEIMPSGTHSFVADSRLNVSYRGGGGGMRLDVGQKSGADGVGSGQSPPALTSDQIANLLLASGGLDSAIGAVQKLPSQLDPSGTLSTLFGLKNSQTTDNASKIANDQQFLGWLQAQPQTIANLQAIASLTSEIQTLSKATDANTAATQATLNPLYSQGHGALAIGYYKAAAGLDMIAQGPTSGDQVPFHAMINGGERVRIEPAGQSSNDNSRQISVVQNFYGISNNNRRRSARQAGQGFAQPIAALG
jgi:hypothetical protein